MTRSTKLIAQRLFLPGDADEPVRVPIAHEQRRRVFDTLTCGCMQRSSALSAPELEAIIATHRFGKGFYAPGVERLLALNQANFRDQAQHLQTVAETQARHHSQT